MADKIELAKLLLRRKQLQEKVDQLRNINVPDLFKIKATRRRASEGIDDVVAEIPKIAMQQVTAAYDWHAKRLREVDAAIQQANWVTMIEYEKTWMEDYVDPYAKAE